MTKIAENKQQLIMSVDLTLSRPQVGLKVWLEQTLVIIWKP